MFTPGTAACAGSARRLLINQLFVWLLLLIFHLCDIYSQHSGGAEHLCYFSWEKKVLNCALHFTAGGLNQKGCGVAGSSVPQPSSTRLKTTTVM